MPGVSWTLRPSDSALFLLVRIQRREDVTVEPKLEAGVVEFVGSLAQSVRPSVCCAGVREHEDRESSSRSAVFLFICGSRTPIKPVPSS